MNYSINEEEMENSFKIREFVDNYAKGQSYTKKFRKLFLKKTILNKISIRKGKWDKDEHNHFLKICLIHGNNWPKVKKLILL